MQKTSLPALIGTAAFLAAAVAILLWRYYGVLTGISPWVSLPLWLLVLWIAWCTWKVTKAKEKDYSIGFDRSQLDPKTIAQYVVLAQAAAWTGTIVGGIYTGFAVYVIPRASWMDAAGNDLLGILTSVLAAAVLVGCALNLERHCEIPPPTDGELAG